MNIQTLTAAALLAASSTQAAFAADPVAVSLTPGYTFAEYAGSATVGIGAVDTNATLFFIDEKAVGGNKSWYVFFDSAAAERVTATLQFDQPILAVYITRSGIDATTPTYGASGVSYGSRPLTGLEKSDTLGWTVGGTTLTLDWIVTDPGDHIRVLTAVPEPASYAMFGAGLLALGWLWRRRVRAD